MVASSSYFSPLVEAGDDDAPLERYHRCIRDFLVAAHVPEYDDDDQYDDDTNAMEYNLDLLNSPATELELDGTESFVLL